MLLVFVAVYRNKHGCTMDQELYTDFLAGTHQMIALFCVKRRYFWPERHLECVTTLPKNPRNMQNVLRNKAVPKFSSRTPATPIFWVRLDTLIPHFHPYQKTAHPALWHGCYDWCNVGLCICNDLCTRSIAYVSQGSCQVVADLLAH